MVVLSNLTTQTRVVMSPVDPDREVPLYRGYGDLDLVCGACGFTIARGLRASSQLQHLVLECGRPRAGARWAGG